MDYYNNLKKVEFTVTDADGETQSYTIDVKVSNVDEAANAWASGLDLTKTSPAEIGSKGAVWSESATSTYKANNPIPSNAVSLISDAGWGANPGQGSDITFSFVDTGSQVFPGGVSLYDTNTTYNGKSVGDFNTLTTPSDNIKAKVREIFQEISKFTLNTFKEVQESTNGTDFTAGQIRIMLMDSGSGGTLGSAFAPNPAFMPPDDDTANYYVGDIYINNNSSINK